MSSSIFTNIVRRKTYAAIDPTRPELSAKGKTIIVTGAGWGSIGSGIALSFAKAGATNIALVGRREKTLQETKEKIQAENPDVQVYISIADLTKAQSVGTAAHWIRVELGAWDVFINSAMRTGELATIAGCDEDDWWQTFEIGVRFYQHFAKHFLPKCRPNATLISINSRQTHMKASLFPLMGANGAAHAAAAKLDEYLAIEKPGLRVFSLHPGRIDRPLLQGILKGPQHDRAISDVDDMSLPSDMCVWLASPEADFLKERFLHANFDVEELVSMRADFETNPALLTVKLSPTN